MQITARSICRYTRTKHSLECNFHSNYTAAKILRCDPPNSYANHFSRLARTVYISMKEKSTVLDPASLQCAYKWAVHSSYNSLRDNLVLYMNTKLLALSVVRDVGIIVSLPGFTSILKGRKKNFLLSHNIQPSELQNETSS